MALHAFDAPFACAGAVKLLTHPHSAGYVQNPISVYYCHDSNGSLSACIAEVSNFSRSDALQASERLCTIGM
jgi:DUF1365 family protein